MKFVIELFQIKQLDLILNHRPDQVILCPRGFSKIGNLSIDEIELVYSKLTKNDISTVFCWDVLHSHKEFELNIKIFKSFSFFNLIPVRLQDPGLLHYLNENLNCKMELILDWGNHNKFGIDKWMQFSPKRITKLILSSQLDYKSLVFITESINCNIELLGLGRPLIFYSPRSLLKPILDTSDDFIELLADGEETSHKKFVVRETVAGTLMYYSKLISLLSEINKLKQVKVNYLRIDFDYLSHLEDIRNQKEFSNNQKITTIKGFFKVNKTDVLFKKLKNSFLINNNEKIIGHIIDVKKKEYMILKLGDHKSVKINDQLELFTPDKKHKIFTIKNMRNLSLQNIDNSEGAGHVLLPHVSGVSIKSICSLLSQSN